MRLRHYFHVYADGRAWREAIEDHVLALTEGDARQHIDEMVVGCVGKFENRNLALDYLLKGITPLGLTVQSVINADEGFEHVTLDAMRRWAQKEPREGLVLYTHTKGAANPDRLATVWRRSMEIRLVRNLGENVALMERRPELDAVGSYWLTHEEYPKLIDKPLFAGTYWLARASYIAKLPEIDPDRFGAEYWIGQANPTVHDLNPGWPGYELCTRSGNLGMPKN